MSGTLDDMALAAKTQPFNGPNNFNLSNWKFGNFKSATKWANQMMKRGWTQQQIQQALKSNQFYSAVNKVNPGNPALRFVHPTTGQSVVIDTVTQEIIQIGGKGFLWQRKKKFT